MGGARDGRPTPSRYRWMAPGSVRAAMIFIDPPQASHVVTSTWKTRANKRAHSTRWRRREASPPPQSADASVSGLGPPALFNLQPVGQSQLSLTHQMSTFPIFPEA